MLDWHPSVLSLPREMPFLKQAFQKNAETYFRYKFANEKKEKQGVYFFKSKQDENLLMLKKRLGYKAPTKINTALFKKYYLKKIRTYFLGHILQKVCNAVGFALLNSSNKIKKRYRKYPAYLVVKNPSISETFARQIAYAIPEARFIHIIRDPISRQISTHKLKEKLFNEKNENRAHAEISLWAQSTRLAIENEKNIGKDKYKVICFENLLNNPEKILKDILHGINIKKSKLLLKPTMLGMATSPNSSFASVGVGIVPHNKVYHDSLIGSVFSRNFWSLLKSLKSVEVEISYYHSKLFFKKAAIYKIVKILPRWIL